MMGIYSLPTRLFKLEIRLRHQLSKQILEGRTNEGVLVRAIKNENRYNTLMQRYHVVTKHVREYLDSHERSTK